ncbi:transporter [Pseudomonas sp. MAFF 302046]|uniref:Transporter n=1 Tax=Pseudomonas morbosilactucae TaxID=2938197 RepID=A0ABT0JPV6_9PSED|nr:transporter [Pseudomonas morbosilactucae]MCK9817908.1 transporter [Pseudomonas morbosilactucae]
MNKLKAVAMSTLVLSVASKSYAFDGHPGDYLWLPDHSAVALIYGQYQSADSFKVDGGNTVPKSKLEAATSIVRGVYFRDLGGVKTSFQFFVPAGEFRTARVGGVDQTTSNGIGDLTVGATIYPLASMEPTGTTLGITAFLTAPTGQYDVRDVSIGGGAWVFTPQLGMTQGLGHGFYLDAYLDVAFRRDSTDRGIKDSVDPATQLQTYLRYQFNPTDSLTFGYSGRYGGKRYLDDDYTGTKTRNDQLRLFAGKWISATSQIEGMLGRDINVKGGFKNDYVVQLRLAKLF